MENVKVCADEKSILDMFWAPEGKADFGLCPLPVFLRLYKEGKM